MQLIFNDIASSEVVLILVFVLIFFGSKSIPGLAKTLGRTMRQIKEASADVQAEIKKSGIDIKKDMNLKNLVNDTVEEIKRPLDQQMNELDNAIKYTPKKKLTPIVEESLVTEDDKEPTSSTAVKEVKTNADSINIHSELRDDSESAEETK